MTENQYAALAGTLLSLVLAYFPYLKDKFEVLRPDYKQLIQIGVLATLVFGRVGLSCIGKDATFTCDTNGLWDALMAFGVAVIANASVYKATNYIGMKKS
jgi:hypothetical protein